MRSFAVVFFAASLASAATILKRQTALPACAQTCYGSTKSQFCAADDLACQCVDVNFIASLAQCVASTCPAADAQTAQAAALEQCKAAGIDLSSGNPVPACAATCENTTSTSCPAPTDPNATPDGACYCKDTTFIQSVNTCLKSSCTGQDLTTAQNVGAALCRAYGVDISSAITA